MINDHNNLGHCLFSCLLKILFIQKGNQENDILIQELIFFGLKIYLENDYYALQKVGLLINWKKSIQSNEEETPYQCLLINHSFYIKNF